jgi:hypothetical protein
MQRVLKTLLSYSLLLSVIAVAGCSGNSNPVINLDDPSTFPGNYEMKSMTFKAGDEDIGFAPGTTVEGGKQTSFSYTDDETGITVNAQVEVNITMVLTTDRYTQTFSVEVSIPGFQIPPDTETDSGAYSIQGNQLTITPDDPEEDTEVFTVTVSGSDMTVENSDTKIVLRKTK